MLLILSVGSKNEWLMGCLLILSVIQFLFLSCWFKKAFILSHLVVKVLWPWSWNPQDFVDYKRERVVWSDYIQVCSVLLSNNKVHLFTVTTHRAQKHSLLYNSTYIGTTLSKASWFSLLFSLQCTSFCSDDEPVGFPLLSWSWEEKPINVVVLEDLVNVPAKHGETRKPAPLLPAAFCW